MNRLMAHDPTKSYNHKELAKIIGALAHNLIFQARLSEKSIIHLEQEAAALKLQQEPGTCLKSPRSAEPGGPGPVRDNG